jgi:type IV pilus assembly protein PilC
VEVINRHVRYEKTIMSVRNRFLNSLIYPAFLIGLAAVMIAIVLTYVIPQFSQLYEDLNVVLPRPTQLLMAFSAAVQQNLLVIVPVLIGAVLGLRIWVGTEGGRHWVDRIKLSAPILGNLWTMFSMAQLSRTLAMLLQGGTPLLTALEVAREASGNKVIADSLAYAISQVRQGKPLSDSLESTGHFPALSIEMMRVGEQTGSLPEMLNHVADFYDEDVNIRSAALLGYIEPIILIFVAAFIGVILVALYAPIFSLGSQIRS